MSIERAIRFCRLCHEYNKLIESENLGAVSYRLLRDFANAQAMQGIESIDPRVSGPIRRPFLLIACANCDYKETGIEKELIKHR